MFFDIFKPKTKSSNVIPFPGWADVPPPPKVEQPKENPALNADAYYTVGVNEHGYTVFKTGHSTLTMNSEAVVAMIEDLAHTIRRKYDIEITKLD